MADVTSSADFYEDDEPVEKLKAAFESGTKHLTMPPRGRTEYLRIGTSFPRVNEASGHLISR